MPRERTPDDLLLKQVDDLMDELSEVRELNQRLHKIAMFLEEIRLVDVLTNYTTPRKLLVTNFLAGLARGLGLTIGTAIVLTAFGTVVSEFLSVPVIGDYIRQIVDYVETYRIRRE